MSHVSHVVAPSTFPWVVRWLPHALTASRGLAGPVVAWLLLAHHANTIAFWLFISAALTDLIDGWLARKLGADPTWGAMLDPLADKVLVGCTWLALGAVGWAPVWLVGLHILRDLIVAGLWAWHRNRGLTWSPSALGQLMTSYEGTAIGVFLFHGPWNGVHWPSVGVVIGCFSLGLSIISGVAYLASGPTKAEEP